MNSRVDLAPDGLVVAMDGTSGSGKSSAARGVARRFGLRYLDTGAQYRAVALWMVENFVDLSDPEAIAARALEPRIESVTDPDNPRILLDGRDVSQEIRGEVATTAVSPVSAVAAVRERLVMLQREVIGHGGIVVEGRDIGTVVWPQALVRVYLTADPAARASRRAAEQGHTDVQTTEEALRRRDQLDSTRTASPLQVPPGAVCIDSTSLTLQQVIEQIVSHCEDAAQ